MARVASVGRTHLVIADERPRDAVWLSNTLNGYFLLVSNLLLPPAVNNYDDDLSRFVTCY